MNYNTNITQKQLQDLLNQYQSLFNQMSSQQNSNIINQPQGQFQSYAQQIHEVDGLQEAIIYQNNLPMGASEIIMDKNKNTMYAVCKDENGKSPKYPMMANFNIVEINEDDVTPLTRKDLEDFKQEIKDLLSSNQKNLSSGAKTTKTTKE